MSKNNSKFHFKQFSVSHHRSSMKVGVDGVLIGCWAEVNGARRVLDVGTGCGLIALIMAQRAPEAQIDAIDIDDASIGEAIENIEASPWSDRIDAYCCGYSEVASRLKIEDGGYDLIISNPPYFDSGVSETVTPREKARHQGELSPSSLLQGGLSLLKDGGSIAMIVPTDISVALERVAAGLGYRLMRKCRIKGHMSAPYKRILMQWILSTECGANTEPTQQDLVLEVAPGEPTDDYRELCKDFYLRF